ncbi:CPBP family intramembrane metalloprotease [Ornithinibacillus sp. L9]|uniref:CPBP family intramembrane metalloprotease n=1 Tax=Ornithinibacillus caprae TaxID=2678566 RepID=A0A6N8FCG9_9BACI|nr:CPBP family intramembrane glutamic endopeptidase [Ornithinibacillus caprae]MUK87243.1 CPBP family intramembrane metalloprotease [Ornithinibacillus caprae]
MKQSELLQQISDQDLKRSLILSQLLFILLALGLSLFLFEHITDWTSYFRWNSRDILLYGVISGIVVVIIDLILIRVFPSRMYDDGGINKRLFSNSSFNEILFFTLLISVAEELLFRGVIQTTFGYLIASTIFALVHFRYLKRPVLLISILILSFYIGYIFEITGNLLVTITCHFFIDFLLGLFIRFNGWGEE